MLAYPTLHAVYRNGHLELREPVRLAEGAEVKIILLEGVAVPMLEEAPSLMPSVSASEFLQLAGLVSVGGDALTDTEAVYDL